jgi:hypothetical protein
VCHLFGGERCRHSSWTAFIINFLNPELCGDNGKDLGFPSVFLGVFHKENIIIMILIKHSSVGQLNSFTHLRALLVLYDRNILFGDNSDVHLLDDDNDDNKPFWATWAVGALTLQGCETYAHQSRKTCALHIPPP